MSREPNYADLARRLVREARSEAPPRLPGDRRRLEAAVAGALRDRGARLGRQIRARRAAGATFAVAAALALALGGPRAFRAWQARGEIARRPAPTDRELTVLAAADDAAHGDAIVGDSRRVPLRGGMTLDAGIRLVAPPADEVRVGSPEGTLLTLEPRADLTVSEASATQRFALHAGAVRAHVARLFAGERFVIDTPDAEIEVHGTAFRVALGPSDPRCGGGTTTRVSVSEGVVTVRAGGGLALVPAGHEWPSGCLAVAEATATGTPARRAVTREAEPRRAPRRLARDDVAAAEAPAPIAAPAPPAPAVPAAAAPAAKVIEASDLSAQNDLFAAAVRAKKQGDAALAARLYGRLIGEHPDGPLVEGATVQRMRLLADLDPAAGARAARDYLARFPAGFARVEAEALAAGAAASP